MNDRPKGPVILEFDDEDATGDSVNPSAAPPVPEPDAPPEGRAMIAATRVAATRVSWWGRLFWGAALSLILLWISTAAWDFTFQLFERNVWLGRLALLAGGILLVAALVFVLRELAALFRLGRMDRIRRDVEVARAEDDLGRARAAATSLKTLYAGRDDARWGLRELEQAEGDALDAGALLDAAERALMPNLDAAVRAEIESSTRQVAMVTAIVPLTMADVVVALTANLRMIRRIAEIYGGRAGRLGSWRLMRSVATHLLATGAVGIADDMIGSVAGGGALARISRRFGEGIINGALTARVGVAAMEVCRPLPFAVAESPGVTSIVGSALRGVFSSGRD